MSKLSCGNGLAKGMTEAQIGTPATTLQVSVLPVGNTGGAPSVVKRAFGLFFQRLGSVLHSYSLNFYTYRYES